MLIPYGTDAPLSRPPWGTLSLIVANILLFFLQDLVTHHSLYVLSFGDGLHPTQWFLATFAHADYCHLVGNMIFLFSFGLVIESVMKLRYFLALYIAIAIVHHIMIQLMMLGSTSGGALGASGAIYGLMMVATIYAPGRNIKWLFLHRYVREIATFEVPVLIVGLFYFLWDFTLTLFSGFAMNTPFLHSTGAIVGICLGLSVYRLNWFKPDGEDLLTRLRAVFDSDPKPKPPSTGNFPASFQPRQFRFGPLEHQTALLEKYLRQNRFHLAKMKLDQLNSEHSKFQLTERQLVSFINFAARHKDWSNALTWMTEYLDRFECHATTIRLNMARIQATSLEDPIAAQQTLARLRPANLTPTQRQLFYRIIKRIRAPLRREDASTQNNGVR